MKQVTIKDFEEAFGEKLSPFVKTKIEQCFFEYNSLTAREHTDLLFEIRQVLDQDLKKVGAHRVQEWNSGWSENKEEVSNTKKFESLIPKYFGKYRYVRWRQELIKPLRATFEYDMVKILQYWLFEKHFSDSNAVYEFGCGTGHNLFRVEEVNPKAKIYGLDWVKSSQETIKLINKNFDKKFQAKQFDFFNVDKKYSLEKRASVYTFAALEQSGKDYKGFIEYLIKQEPSVCLHVEPIAELLNPQYSILDSLSVEYFQRRNYLNGFLNFLKALESDGIIEIIDSRRSQIGSLFVDGYSVVAWRPTNA
jgi:SAM-dependent methyltransferase